MADILKLMQEGYAGTDRYDLFAQYLKKYPTKWNTHTSDMDDVEKHFEKWVVSIGANPIAIDSYNWEDFHDAAFEQMIDEFSGKGPHQRYFCVATRPQDEDGDIVSRTGDSDENKLLIISTQPLTKAQIATYLKGQYR